MKLATVQGNQHARNPNRKPLSSRMWRAGAIMAILWALLILAAPQCSPFASTARRALPYDARDVHEYYSGFVDFERLLKAKIPEEKYLACVLRLGLTNGFDPKQHAAYASVLRRGFSGVPEWWGPPADLATCYFDYTPGKDYYAAAWYKDGYIYFCASAW